MPSLCRVRTLLRLLACFALVIPAFALAATTNVSVGQGGTNFVPSSVTIQAGDTVKWTWASNNHSATSGNLTPDGLFDSGIHNSRIHVFVHVRDRRDLSLLLQGPRSDDEGHGDCDSCNTDADSHTYTNSHGDTYADPNATRHRLQLLRRPRHRSRRIPCSSRP